MRGSLLYALGISVALWSVGPPQVSPARGEEAAPTVLLAAARAKDQRASRAEQRRNLSEIQRCLTATGYYKGPVNGRLNKQTRRAFWFFKQENGLKALSDPFSPRASEKLFELCKAEDDRRAALETAPAGLSPPAPEAAPAEEERPSAAEPVDCLYPDIAALLEKSRRRKPDAPSCARSCLPKPAGLGATELDLIAEEYDLAWCESCLAMSTPLPLEDILRLERASGVEICAAPYQLRSYVAGRRAVSEAPRALWRGLPPGTGNEKSIAVIVSVDDYPDAVVEGGTARADADAMVTLLVEHLKFDQDNLIELRDAKTADFERVFGPAAPVDGKFESELSARLKANPDAPVIVYFSGRGGVSVETGETFLVPSGTPRHRETGEGFPLAALYERLAALDAKSVLVLLEASFASDPTGTVLAPNMPLQEARILPAAPLPRLSVISAATGDQRTLSDPQWGAGLFTRRLVEAMAGRADAAPIGDGDLQTSVSEIYAYTAQFTRRAAARSYGLMQTPSLSLQTDRISVVGRLEGPTQ
jgi:peptidoglycan hydrolase-like protein with peptidoglycan-binding domain